MITGLMDEVEWLQAIVLYALTGLGQVEQIYIHL